MDNNFIQLTAVSTDTGLSEPHLPVTFQTDSSSKDGLSIDESGMLSNGTVFVESPRGFLLPSTDGEGNITYSTLTGTVDEAGNRLVHLPVQLFLPTGEDGLVDSTDYDVSKKILCIQTIDTNTASTVTQTNNANMPKRKGGWPKGKKRKNTPEVKAPRAPLSGYVIYAMERRQQIKEINPELPFVEVTKILGQEWSSMSTDKKQKYLDEASADKQRYIDELKVFQQSEQYKNYIMKKRKLKQINGGDVNDIIECISDNYNPIIDVEDDSVGELHCRVCNQYFSSLHNKKEHMFGRQHLQAITGDLEKELANEQAQQQLQQHQNSIERLTTTTTVTSSLPGDTISISPLTSSPHSSFDSQHVADPLDMQSFIENFLQKNSEREQEIKCLRRNVQKAQEKHLSMLKEIQELQDYQEKSTTDLKNMVNYSGSVSAQIDGLKMVPTLFGVINF
ncbi:hypothetical protein LOTGIDRAFT_231408 [Lottia gigantea]|uniref:HMG box domain-containing protein n=1 Tax=Lottia gigantea TaxID=225164 RepID=V4AMH9_LOTGI|nr:hypothetical protein LOTGIDRAFT_231408 [Lottia gigantea]ESO98342.1 hypothetical protein LOTGIDRAFT_231408 [Lottia gigantea]